MSAIIRLHSKFSQYLMNPQRFRNVFFLDVIRRRNVSLSQGHLISEVIYLVGNRIICQGTGRRNLQNDRAANPYEFTKKCPRSGI